MIIENTDDLYVCLYNLISNKNKIFELGANAQKRAIEEFHWDVVIKKYLALINRIIKSK